MELNKTLIFLSVVSGHLVPSPILGLANAPIVETKFLELAMSLLDSSPRIPLGTFSILLCITTKKENKQSFTKFYLLCSSIGNVIEENFSIKRRERVKFRISFSYSNNVFLLAVSFVVTEIERVENVCSTPPRRHISRGRKWTVKSVVSSMS